MLVVYLCNLNGNRLFNFAEVFRSCVGRVCDDYGYEVSGMHGSQAGRLSFVLGVVQPPPLRLITTLHIVEMFQFRQKRLLVDLLH